MEDFEIAKLAYSEITKAIRDLENQNPGWSINIPDGIEVNGEYYDRRELLGLPHLFWE